MQRSLTLLALFWACHSTACHSNGQIAPETLRSIALHTSSARGSAVFAAPQRLAEVGGGVVPLDPQAMVRGHLANGELTEWFQAGDLSASAEGLFVRDGLPAAAVAKVAVRGLAPRPLALLNETAPPGGTVLAWGEDERRLKVTAPGEPALAWASRFAGRAVAEGLSAGIWRLERDASVGDVVLQRGPRPMVTVRAPELVAAASPGATFSPGFRWDELQLLEVRYLDPVKSALTLPLLPLVLLVGALDPGSVERSTSATAGEIDERETVRVFRGGETPLFTGRARRRAVIKALGAVDVTAGFRGDVTAGLSLGARLRDFYELTVVGRQLSLRGVLADGSRANRLAIGGGMGLHVDPDGDPRRALFVGIEYVRRGGEADTDFGTLKWGLRLGVGGSWFFTVMPLNISLLSASAGPGVPAYRDTRLMFSVDVGGSL